MTRALSKTDVYRENASEALTKITNFWLTECWAGEILLMEEILHHLGCMKPCKYWDFNYQPQLVSPISEPSTVLHYLHNSQEFLVNMVPMAPSSWDLPRSQDKSHESSGPQVLPFSRSARSALFNCAVREPHLPSLKLKMVVSTRNLRISRGPLFSGVDSC